MKFLIVTTLIFTIFVMTFGQRRSRVLPSQALENGYWPLEKSQPILDKTQTIRLAPDLSQLTEGERKAVAKLLEVGRFFRASTKISDICMRFRPTAISFSSISAMVQLRPRRICSPFIA